MTEIQWFTIDPTIKRGASEKKPEESHGATEHQYDTPPHPASNKNERDLLQSRLQNLADTISRSYQPAMSIDDPLHIMASQNSEHHKATEQHDIINNLYSAYSRQDPGKTADLVQEINQIQYHTGSVNQNISTMTSVEIVEEEIDKEISKRIKNRHLPPIIQLLLSKIWKQVMLNIYFDTDCGKTEWEESKTFIDLMLCSVQPQRTSAEKHNLIKLIPVVAKDMKHGLQRLHCPDTLQEKLLAHLRAQHLIALGKK